MTAAAVLAGEARHHVEQGDCLPWLATLPAGCVQHVITDPPYSEHVHGKSRAGSRAGLDRAGNGKVVAASFSRAAEFGFPAITQDQRDGCSDHFARLALRWSLVFSDVESAHLWKGALTDAALDHCRTGAWVKVGCTPQFSGDRPGAGFEAITICHRKGRKKWNGGGTQAVWSVPIVLDRGGVANRVHTTQKPLDLMLRLVELFTDPDDIILDPFAGSGTTGVAALRLGRRFIGCELDPKYHAIAVERLSAEADGSTLQAQRAGQVPLFGAAS